MNKYFVLMLGMVDKKELSKVLNLAPQKKVVLTQTVGYPK